MTTGIKVIKEPPSRSMCSYPEAIFLLHRSLPDDLTKQACAAATLSVIFDRDVNQIVADLLKGVP